MKKTTALYIRVSTEAQAEEGYSIEAQKKLLEAYCISKEIEKYEFYIDGGFTGSNIDRPELKRLIDDIKNGTIEAVAVYKLDRLSRSQKDTLYLIEDVLNKHGVGFISLSENMDTQTPIGRAMLGIMSAFAQLERETIKMRTRMGMRERVKSGLWPGGGKVPFGYDYDKTTGTLIENDDAEKVREVYRLYNDGLSPNKIAKRLGFKYERLVTEILKRKTNLGIIKYNGEEYNGNHKAIIEADEFDKAMNEMKKRSRGKRYESTHLLSGLIFCGKCGARMRYQKWGKQGYKLVCYSQQKSKPYLVHNSECDLIRHNADEIEDIVIKDIFCMGIEKEEKNGENNNIKLLENEIKKLQSRLSRLFISFGDGDDDALDVINNTKAEIKRLQDEIDIQKRSYENDIKTKEIIKEISSVKNIWETLDISKKREIIKSVVDKIIIYDNMTRIFYNFE